MEIITTGAIAALLWYLIIYWWRRNRNSPARIWPLVGMVPGLLHNAKRIHDYGVRCLKASSENTLFLQGGLFKNMNYVITSNPTNASYILCKNYTNYSKRPKFRDIAEHLGECVIRAEDEPWKIQRKIVHGMINSHKFESALEKVISRKVESSLVPILDHFSQSGLVLDLQDVIQRRNFDCGSEVLLGFDPNYLSMELPTFSNEILSDEMGENVIRRYLVPEVIWKLQRWFRIGVENKYFAAWETFDKFLYDCISSKRDTLCKKPEPESESDQQSEFNLLTAFLLQEEKEEVSKNVKVKSDQFLRDTTFSLFGAGKDIVSSALSWAMWLISTHPSVETKLIEKLKLSMKGKVSSTIEDVNKLVYLHAVLCETLRLYPSIPFTQKTSSEPDVLPSGHRVDGNTSFLISFYAMGRMAEIWGDDCLEFKPERCISDEGKIKSLSSSYQFVAFGAGPRSCIGKRLGFVQMKLVASDLIWNYRFQAVENHPVLPRPSIFFLCNMV